MFAQVSGTKGSEKNGDKVNAKISMLSEFTETGTQNKRIRLDPQETNKKAASYSSSSKTNLSSKLSRLSQASEQQTSKKSGEKLIILYKNSGGFFQTYMKKAICNA